MGVLTEGKHAGDFIHWEQDSSHSREQVNIAGGISLGVGDIAGKLTGNKKYAGYNPDGVDGTEVASGVVFDDVYADGSADTNGILIVRQATLNYAKTEFFTNNNWTNAEKATALDQLAVAGITFVNVPQTVIDLTTNGYYGGVTISLGGG